MKKLPAKMRNIKFREAEIMELIEDIIYRPD